MALELQLIGEEEFALDSIAFQLGFLTENEDLNEKYTTLPDTLSNIWKIGGLYGKYSGKALHLIDIEIKKRKINIDSNGKFVSLYTALSLTLNTGLARDKDYSLNYMDLPKVIEEIFVEAKVL